MAPLRSVVFLMLALKLALADVPQLQASRPLPYTQWQLVRNSWKAENEGAGGTDCQNIPGIHCLDSFDVVAYEAREIVLWPSPHRVVKGDASSLLSIPEGCGAMGLDLQGTTALGRGLNCNASTYSGYFFDDIDDPVQNTAWATSYEGTGCHAVIDSATGRAAEHGAVRMRVRVSDGSFCSAQYRSTEMMVDAAESFQPGQLQPGGVSSGMTAGGGGRKLVEGLEA